MKHLWNLFLPTLKTGRDAPGADMPKGSARPDGFYVVHPGETAWDHANRILSYALMDAASHFIGFSAQRGPQVSHCMGSYVMNFSKTKASLRELLTWRDHLRQTISWERVAPDQYRSQVISSGNAKAIEAHEN